MGADTKKIRTSDSIKLIEYTYNNYELVNLEEKINETFNRWCNINRKRIYVYKGEKENVNLDIGGIKYNIYPIKKEDIDKIKLDIDFIKYIEAPVLENTKIGEIELYLNITEIQTIDIIVSEEIKRKSVKEYMLENLKLLIYSKNYI